ncbi:MAG TPA: hypothetical protein VFM18_21270, partial [Methanosarcina sp.]|nr:hypothetical protein [Methanosarcina sp.]
GEKLSNETLKKLTGDITTSLLASLRGLGKKNPNRKTLREQIEQSLQNMPFAKDRATLDQYAASPDSAPNKSKGQQAP